MNTLFILETEVQQHQLDVRTNAQKARNTFSIRGVRQLFGNTLIALGLRLQGIGEDRSTAPVSRPIALPAHSL